MRLNEPAQHNGVRSRLQVSSHHEELLKKCKTACLTLKRRFENELDPTIQQLLEDAKPSQVANHTSSIVPYTYNTVSPFLHLFPPCLCTST